MRIIIPFVLALVPRVLSSAATDQLQDADPMQSGYVGGDHNLHPSTVGSSAFGILWKKTYGVLNEMW